jgi:hypothetical protein
MGLIGDLRAAAAHASERAEAISEKIREASIKTTLLEIQVKQLTDEANQDGK